MRGKERDETKKGKLKKQENQSKAPTGTRRRTRTLSSFHEYGRSIGKVERQANVSDSQLSATTFVDQQWCHHSTVCIHLVWRVL